MMNSPMRARSLSDDEARFQVAHQSPAVNEGADLVAEDPSALGLGMPFSSGQEADSRTEVGGRAPGIDEGIPLVAEDPSLVSGLSWRRGAAGLGIAHGLPNLTFGPPGPNGNAAGAPTFGSTPIQGSPVQIMWTDFNESDTMAGSYWDEVWIVDESGREVFRDRVRASGLAPGGNETHYVAWTPAGPGHYTAYVQLNSGAYAIPEDNINDNQSNVSAVIGSPYGRARALDNGLSVREVNNADGLNPRYGYEQNVGSTFHGSVRARYDRTHRFIWLVWPHRAKPEDPPASVDIDLTIDVFAEDPHYNANAVPVDTRLRRIQLQEDAPFGYEYSRLPDGVDYFIRITFTDYSQTQNAGSVLWTQGYG